MLIAENDTQANDKDCDEYACEKYFVLFHGYLLLSRNAAEGDMTSILCRLVRIPDNCIRPFLLPAKHYSAAPTLIKSAQACSATGVMLRWRLNTLYSSTVNTHGV
jgi:hypothetical protein